MDEETAISDMRALEELPDLRNRLAALESELGLGDSGDDWSDPVLPNGSFYDRCWHCVCKSVTVPCVFLVTVLVAVCVIVFCIFPASIVMVVAVAFYYCCARDPIPFRVLLTAMLGADSGDGSEAARPIRTAADIHPALIKRRCLGKTTATQSEIEKDQYLMETEGGMLLFSNPLSEEDLEGRDDTAPWLAGVADKAQDVDSSDEEENERDDDMEHDAETGGEVGDGVDIEPDTEKDNGVMEPMAVDGVDSETPQREKETTKQKADPILDNGNDRKDPPDDAPFDEGDVEMNIINRKEEGVPEPGHHDESESHSCDICLLAFEKNQVVAWSNNAQCEHAYHLDCITDWLIKQKTCPNCRADYLRSK